MKVLPHQVGDVFHATGSDLSIKVYELLLHLILLLNFILFVVIIILLRAS